MTNATGNISMIPALPPSLRANTVAEILAARKAATAVQISKAVDAVKGETLKEAVRETQVAGVKASQLSEADLSAFLNANLPEFVNAATELVAPPFRWSEVQNLARIVTAIVASGLPSADSFEVTVTVTAIVTVLFDKFIAPRLPVWLKPFSGMVRGTVIKGIEAAIKYATSKIPKKA